MGLSILQHGYDLNNKLIIDPNFKNELVDYLTNEAERITNLITKLLDIKGFNFDIGELKIYIDNNHRAEAVYGKHNNLNLTRLKGSANEYAGLYGVDEFIKRINDELENEDSEYTNDDYEEWYKRLEPVEKRKQDYRDTIFAEFLGRKVVLKVNGECINSSIHLYLLNIFDGCNDYKEAFSRLIKTFAHEVFHAYYQQHTFNNNYGYIWEDYEPANNVSIVIESLTDYFGYLYCKYTMRRNDYADEMERKWDRYNMYLVPHSGAKYMRELNKSNLDIFQEIYTQGLTNMYEAYELFMFYKIDYLHSFNRKYASFDYRDLFKKCYCPCLPPKRKALE